MERALRDLIFSIKRLTEENRKMNSFGNNFLRGMFFGVGSAIGASVIAAIILGVITKFFESFKNIKF